MIYLGVVGGKLAGVGTVELDVGVFSLRIDVLGLGADPLGTVKFRARGAILVVSSPWLLILATATASPLSLYKREVSLSVNGGTARMVSRRLIGILLPTFKSLL